MPRPKSPASERISVELPGTLARRLIHAAKAEPGKPTPEDFARALIIEGLERREMDAEEDKLNR